MALAAPISWAVFSDRFQTRYFDAVARYELRQRFINLKQDSLTIDGYVAEYARLSRFAPTLVATELDRTRGFPAGTSS